MGRGTVMRCVRRLAAGLALAGLACVPLHALADKETERAMDPIAYKAEVAMLQGDFDTLERLYLQARGKHARNPWNGGTETQSVRSGLSAVFRYGDLNDAYFREVELLTERWARERPESALAQLLYARALYARAWSIRGSSIWRAVPEPAKAEFTRLIAKAESQLTSQAILEDDPTTSIYLLKIGRSANWTFEQSLAQAQRAVALSIDEEDASYDEVAFSLSPKWGGSLEETAFFIEQVDARTRDRRGHELYALLWSSADSAGLDGNIFEVTRARWPLIKEGYERLMTQRSDPYYLNRLAYFACKAQDRETARAALAKIKDEPDLSAWAGSGASGRTNYQSCVRWLADKS